MSLLLIRHPRVIAPAGICYGQSDLACEPEHAKTCVSDWVQALPVKCELWHSPLQRCERHIKEIIGQRPDIVAKSDPRLLEMHFGHWEMLAWADVGREAMDLWLGNFRCNKPNHHASAESVAYLLQRVGGALSEAKLRLSFRPVAWLTHAGVIRAATALASGKPIQTASDWPAAPIDFGSITQLAI